jgi:hypothetical protein
MLKLRLLLRRRLEPEMRSKERKRKKKPTKGNPGIAADLDLRA